MYAITLLLLCVGPDVGGDIVESSTVQDAMSRLYLQPMKFDGKYGKYTYFIIHRICPWFHKRPSAILIIMETVAAKRICICSKT